MKSFFMATFNPDDVQVFDYKSLVRQWEHQLQARIAQYARDNPMLKLPIIAEKFNCGRSLVQCAMRRNGVQRKQGRKSWHWPKKAQ